MRLAAYPGQKMAALYWCCTVLGLRCTLTVLSRTAVYRSTSENDTTTTIVDQGKMMWNPAETLTDPDSTSMLPNLGTCGHRAKCTRDITIAN